MSVIIEPITLREAVAPSPALSMQIEKTRHTLRQIMTKQDDRLAVIVGPCSIHNSDSAMRYAEKLKQQMKQHADTLLIVMRAYIEKPRTSIGWKGFINDPDLNNTFQINKGLWLARQLLHALNAMEVPVGVEIVNPFTALYFSDLMSWSVIGARTTESQLHRELASDLSCPVGFKNSTHGDIQVAIDAVQTAWQPHHFITPDLHGKNHIKQSAGNPFAHVVLRGSHTQTNYDAKTVQETNHALQERHLIDRVLIDCSHGNSQRNPQLQHTVIESLAERLENPDHPDHGFFGVMIESHLRDGKQIWSPHETMHPDVSITDACMGWAQTEMALARLSQAVQIRRQNMVNC